jgi:DNA-binding NarL/FixJ family response regulator
MSVPPPDSTMVESMPSEFAVADPISVLYADEHPILHAAVARTLFPIARLLPLVHSVKALDTCLREGNRIDLLLMEARFGDESSIKYIPRLLRRRPLLPIVIFTAHRGPEACARALSLGAVGYVLKSCPEDELIGAVRAAMRGTHFISTAIGVMTRQPGSRINLLSPRQLSVVRGLRSGLSYKDLAFEHQISESGVEYHVRRIKKVLDLPVGRHVDWRNLDLEQTRTRRRP